MIVYAALLPHHAQLLQEPQDSDSSTLVGLTLASRELADAHPDIIVIISQHGTAQGGKTTIQNAPTYRQSLKRFGLVGQDTEYQGALVLTERLLHAARLKHLPLAASSSSELDKGAASTLALLNTNSAHVIPICPGTDSITDLFKLGYALKDVLQIARERIAIIVSADAGHEITQFDESLLSILTTRSAADLTLFRHASDATDCVTRALALAFGMLRRFPTETSILSHEIQGGIGLVCARLFRD